MIKVLFFDLGETLVQYYTKEQFNDLLPLIFENLYTKLSTQLKSPRKYYWYRMIKENYVNTDYSVRPLSKRLSVIFEINEDVVDNKMLCDIFMKPILDLSKLYDDTKIALNELSKKYLLCLISNMPWGCSSKYFIQDLEKHNLLGYFKKLLFCVDVGYRKPHNSIFEYALHIMNTISDESIMIGDRYNWDIEGAGKLNIKGILVDRKKENTGNILKVRNLLDLQKAIAEL